MNLKIFAQKIFVAFLATCFIVNANAQLKSFKISVKGDTLNAIDQTGRKQGKWVVHVDPLRGEPGYEEEGIFVNDLKEGMWRKYSLRGDLIALENYKKGDKDGLSQYFSPLGDLLREENWRAYNPDQPYDTIAIYGTVTLGAALRVAAPFAGEWHPLTLACGGALWSGAFLLFAVRYAPVLFGKTSAG